MSTTPKFNLTTNEGVLDSLVSFAQKIFNPTEPIYPMFVLVNESGQSEVISGLIDGEMQSKDGLAKFVRDRVEAMKAVRIGFMSEAWALSSEDDPSIRERAPTGSLEFHEKRREVVHIIVEDKWGKGAAAVFDINRKSETEATLSEPKKGFPGTSSSGRFANFFDVQQATTH